MSIAVLPRSYRIAFGIALLLSLLCTLYGGHLVKTLTADNSKAIDLTGIPDVVVDAVRTEKPDGVITAAEFENDGGVDMYEITVLVGDVEYEVDVSPSGEVLDVVVDDDSGDYAMLKLGYALVIVGPTALVVSAAVVWRLVKQKSDREDVHKRNVMENLDGRAL
mmetsp:Transcript_5543/g.11102  ORF Transcript_5543/g.11102 Transcript_5543/m.11102 type:complete len:164 (-) Transcript_5543:64-555(-)